MEWEIEANESIETLLDTANQPHWTGEHSGSDTQTLRS